MLRARQSAAYRSMRTIPCLLIGPSTAQLDSQGLTTRCPPCRCCGRDASMHSPLAELPAAL